MFSFDAHRGGFATIAIIGGVAVAVVAGGVFYFLRSDSPEVDTVLKDDSATVFGEETILSVDAEEALLRSLPRGRTDDYCSLLGLEREACADGVEAVCRDLFGSCKIDLSGDSSDTVRQFAEACLVLRTAEGRSQYFTWLDSGDPKPFPLYYAIFGLTQDSFSQKGLADAYQALLDTYLSSLACDNPEVFRLLAEGYLTLGITEGRAMYDEWLAVVADSPFPLYYAVFGLRQSVFTQQKLAAVFKELVGQYFRGYYGKNPEVLRLLVEAYMALYDESSLSAYNGFLAGNLLSDFSTSSFTFSGDGVLSALDDSGLSPSEIGGVLSSLGLSPTELVNFVDSLALPPTELGNIFAGLNLPPDDFSAVLNEFNLPPDNLSAALGSASLSSEGLGVVLGGLDLSIDNLSSVLSGLDLSVDNLSGVLSSLDLSIDNLSGVLSGLDLSVDNLSGVLSGLDLSTDNLSSVLSGLDLSTDNLSGVLNGLTLSTEDLSGVLSGLNLSTEDLSGVLSGLNLSTDDLSTVLSGLTVPSIDAQILFANLDIPPLEGTPFPGITVPSDDADDLPVVTISPVPSSAQIGLLNTGVQPSFRLKITKDGSPYTPDPAAPITVALRCRDAVQPASQPTSDLISSDLPESIVLSASEGTTGDLVRHPDVTGYVACTVVAGAATDPPYKIGSPSSVRVTVFGGSFDALCERPPCDDDPTSGLSPAVSIAAVEPSVASGQPAEFRVFSGFDVVGPLYVQYSCSSNRTDTVVDAALLGEKEVIIQGGSGFSTQITLPTREGVSDVVTCELLDGTKSAYRISSGTASVGVGLLGPEDLEGYDPSLPTVSLVAYRTAPGKSLVFSEKVDSTVVGDTDTYIGLVIDDPKADSFGTEGPRTPVPNGELYVLYVTDFGNTISVLPGYAVGDERTVVVGISKDSKVPDSEPLSTAAVGEVVAEYSAYRSPPTAVHPSDRTRSDGSRWGGNFANESIFIQITSDHRVIMRNDADGTMTVCGYDGDTLYCATYTDTVAPRNMFVTAECRKEFSDRSRSREVSDLIAGGRRVVNSGSYQPYAFAVSGYDPVDRGDPKGNLYTFIYPDGTYDALGSDEGPRVTLSPIGIDPFLEPDTTFSCRLSGGGADDNYNVGTPYAEVRVRPRATISLGVQGARRVVDEQELFGEPFAHLDQRHGVYKFGTDASRSDFSGFETGGSEGILDVDASFSDVAAGLGASLSVGFLTSFGACVGSSLLNRGISELANKIGLGGFGSVSVRDEQLGLKECVLDSAVSGAVLEVLTAVARDYITWASEGFEDKPLFVKNPTTFYKNLRDDAIGRVIDRSGLGFLCDIGVPNLEAYEATLKINLQQQYLGIAADRPRCTYSDLENNLEDFYDDASDVLHDFKPEYLRSFGFTIDGTAKTQDAGTFQFPLSDGITGNRLDALSATLDRVMKKTENSSNFLLAISQTDSDIREARQNFDAAVKPVSQIFNPNDATSIGAFRECDETENPEGDADCFSLNLSGSKITDMTGKGISAISDRLLHIDEFGEFGQLVGMAVNATSAGLMKKYLHQGFGHSVNRETADLLSNIEKDAAAALRPASSRTVSLSENWWSVFFERNTFYNDLLNAEMYANDVLTLLQYIGAGLYQDPKRTDDKAYIPPVRPYNAFDTVRHAATNGAARQFPTSSFFNLLNFSSAQFSRNYANVYTVDDVRKAFEERSLEDINGDDNWVERRLQHIFNDWADGEDDEEKGYRKLVALERFNDVYRFLSNGDTRAAYNEFLDKMGLFIENAPYKLERDTGKWRKSMAGIPDDVKADIATPGTLPKLLDRLRATDSLTGAGQRVYYPSFYANFANSVFGSSSERRCGAAGCPDTLCLFPQTRVTSAQPGLGSRCQLSEADGGTLHYCNEELATDRSLCTFDVDVTYTGSGRSRTETPTRTCEVYKCPNRLPCQQIVTEHPQFIQYTANANSEESYCPAGGTSDKLLNAHQHFATIKQLRKIYEATLAVHIRLVGTIDEYRGSPLLSPPVHTYRRKILDASRADPDSGRDEEGGGWAVVQRGTLKKFRDGTMQVYIPLDDGEFSVEDYTTLLGSDCPSKGTITFKDGAFIRSYQEMNCILGTVFQDQAYFVVRRENDDLSERRVVYLACGYDDEPAAPDDQPDETARFRFKKVAGGGNPRPLPPVPLEEGQASAVFSVPKPIWSPFDSGNNDSFNKNDAPPNYTPLAGQRIRCSIDLKRTRANGVDIDADKLTQVITVSEHLSNNASLTTFHSLVRTTLNALVDPLHKTRKDMVAEALFYTYVWGWYTGFIEMPYYSIQGLLSNPPVILTDSKVLTATHIQGNQEVLRRYRFLSSLFANESDPRFSSKNFGFLTPAEARIEYEQSFDDRFNGYFGRALGEFFELLPDMYQ